MKKLLLFTCLFLIQSTIHAQMSRYEQQTIINYTHRTDSLLRLIGNLLNRCEKEINQNSLLEDESDDSNNAAPLQNLKAYKEKYQYAFEKNDFLKKSKNTNFKNVKVLGVFYNETEALLLKTRDLFSKISPLTAKSSGTKVPYSYDELRIITPKFIAHPISAQVAIFPIDELSKPTSMTDTLTQIFMKNNFTLYDVGNIIQNSLRMNGDYDPKIYLAEDNKSKNPSFYILNNIEQIQKNGNSLSSDNRWNTNSIDVFNGNHFSLDAIKKWLSFEPRIGYYRLFVFEIKKKEVKQDELREYSARKNDLALQSVKAIVKTYGSPDIPDNLKTVSSKEYIINTLVFEFNRNEEDGPVIFIDNNMRRLKSANARQHLELSGIIDGIKKYMPKR